MEMQIKIRVYVHVTLINSYLFICKKLFDKMESSGLLADCECVNVCALGSADELPKLKELMSKYQKIQLRDHSENKNLWEAFCLQHLKKDADMLPKFYAVYVHSKGVTYPEGGDGEKKTHNDFLSEQYWGDYMAWGVIERWRDNYKALSQPDMGYDIAGVRAIPLRDSASLFSHFSGNFVMVNSEYVKTLPIFSEDESIPDVEKEVYKLMIQVRELRKTGRFPLAGNIFGAEMWWYHNQPIMYIACNALTIGMPHHKTFSETIESGYPIEEYCTRP